MDRAKWIRVVLVQLFVGIFVLASCLSPDISSLVRKAALFFYAGFSVITLLIVFFAWYSKSTLDAANKAGRALMGVGVKFLLTLILLVIYLAIGGFKTGAEALIIVPMYIIYSWLAYHLAKN
jgi:hypothetical protein